MSETAVDPAPAPPARRSLPRRCAAGLLGVVRHPWRLLAVLVLLGVVVAGAVLLGRQWWAGYHFRAARDLVAQHRDIAAVEHLEKCRRVWPDDPDVLFLAARCARRRGQLDAASRLLDRYQKQRGADADLVLERLLLRVERGELEATAAFCEERIRDSERDAPQVLEALIRGLLRSYRLGEVRKRLEQWREIEPDSAQLEFLYGAYEDLRDFPNDALDHYRRSVELDGERDDVRERLADMLVRLGKAEEALPHIERLMAHYPDAALLRLRLGLCKQVLGERDEARRLLDDVLESEPDLPAALAARGEMALTEKDYPLAERLLRRSLNGAPGQQDVRYQLQRALTLQHKDQEARAEQERIEQMKKDARRVRMILMVELQQRPRDPDLCCEAGRLSLKLGSTEEGLRWLHAALEINANHKATHAALAEYYARMGNHGLAARHEELAGAKPAPQPR